VRTANIAGVALAVTLGGPGALFWMWVVALLGMATSFAESTLAQVFKVRNADGIFRGGPAYYMQRGLALKGRGGIGRVMGIVFAVMLIFSYGLIFPMVQSNTIAATLDSSHHVSTTATAIILMLVTAPILLAGMRFVARVTEWLVPLMALAYLAVVAVVIAVSLPSVPAVFGDIIAGAFGLRPGLAGVGGGLFATFLNGKTDELTRTLQHKMQTAAANLQFEEAARYRDQIQALGIMQSNQFIDSKNPNNPNDIDLLALAVSDGLVCVHWVSIRGGRHVGDKSFFPDTKNDPEPNGQDYAEAFVAQHYLGKSKPDIIISNFPVPDALKEALEGEHGKQMQFVTKTIGERKVWLKMAEQNAQMAIAQRRLQQSSQQHRIDELAKILNMNSDDLNRLECFDISHTQGEATIASCVVYDEQNIQPSQYRRYNITTAKPGDAYAD